MRKLPPNFESKKSAAGKILAYKNPGLPASARVKDQLSRVTLAEKAAQLMCIWQEKVQKLVDAQGNFEQRYL